MATIDVHVHLAGIGAGGSGCHVSSRMRSTFVFHFLKRKVGLDLSDPRADHVYAERLAAMVRAAPHVDRVVALAMDGVYDEAGRVDLERSHMIVPNDHLFDICRRHPELLPGCSVHPLRKDAIEELDRCASRGAVLAKWLAPLQHFDPSDPACKVFYKALARLELPLLAHSGCEHTFPGMAQELGQPDRYTSALEEGVTVIFAHCATACALHRSHHRLEQLLALMERYPNLHADVSALASPLKFHYLTRVPFDRFPGRFLHGSDFPIPSLAFPYVFRLGVAETLRLTFHDNALEVDYLIKKGLGVPDDVFASTQRVLAKRIAAWDAVRSA